MLPHVQSTNSMCCREGNDSGQERTVTYQEMLDLVCQVGEI